MPICSSNASAFERRNAGVHVQANEEVGLYIHCLSRPANMHPAAVGTQRSFSTSLMRLASTGHLKVLVKGLRLHLLVYTTLCRKVPPETFRCLQCLIDTVAFFMSLLSALPNLGLGVTEILSVLVNALQIMLLAFKRPISHSLSGLVPSAICHEGAWSDISAVDAAYF